MPGGSSSGTGVAVAARLAPAGIGSDTGGSVRIPSAFNGLVGLKVTFGRIGLSGTMLLSWTLDSIGPMARSVEDCALMLNALAAPDPRDPTTLDQPLEDFAAAAKPGSIEGMRVAIPDTKQLPNFMHPDVTKAWQTAGLIFESLGATVEAVRMPDWYFDLSRPAGTIIASEAYSLHRDYIENMNKAIGPGVRMRAQTAKSFLAGAYAEEIRAMASRRRAYTEWMKPYDAVLLPTMAVPAIPLAEVDESLADPGLSHATGQLSRPVQPRHALGSVGRPADRHPDRRQALRRARRAAAGQGLPGRDRLPPPVAGPHGTRTLSRCPGPGQFPQFPLPR